jgi:ATP/ADP translocase
VQFLAPLTAAVLIAQQVGSNAIRDGLFLSWFPVTSLPYFIAGAAVLSIPAAQSSGRFLARFSPARVVPVILGLSGVLFLAEWALLGWQPQAVSVLLYLHSSVLGSIALSAFWSLLNERFDPHSAKPVMAKVAAAATLGGLAGGVGAERVVALLSQGALLLLLGICGAIAVAGVFLVGRGMPARRPGAEMSEVQSGWTEIRRLPLLRDLAVVIALAAALAALVDYVLKAEAVAFFGKGEPLVRFFGLFYAATGFTAFLLQATLGKLALSRLGLGGSVASHPVIVGAAGLIGFVAPAPWRGMFPRGLDVAVRNSVFRAGYELFYTPMPEATKRSAKSIIDVAWDCIGKGAGAGLILLLTGFDHRYSLAAVNLASVLTAGAEFFVARRLRAGYVQALEGGLRRQAIDLEQAAQYSLADFTSAGSMAGLDRTSVLRALGQVAEAKIVIPSSADPVVAAIADLRSDDRGRIEAVLRHPPRDSLVVGALIPLLARSGVLREVVAALTGFGTRAAGQLVDALLDPATPDVVRRRLPLALKSCASPLARDGLVQALASPSFEVRLRCGRALLALTDDHPELAVTPQAALAAVERELAQPGNSAEAREHVFNLLALGLEREPVHIAARTFDTDDAYARGTALEYLEMVLSPALFAALQPRLATPGAPTRGRRGVTEVRADLLRAGETLRMSAAQVRREMGETKPEDAS